MTDREMLELCMDAFKALPTATTSKVFIKKYGFKDAEVVYGGTASYKLAKSMYRRLREHLGVQE
jgi:hypothetical protein